jgi:hypothetical protein
MVARPRKQPNNFSDSVKSFMSEIAIETSAVWTAFGTFVLGMFAGVLIVQSEAKRARRRWREVKRKWHEIEAVAIEIPNEDKELPRHNAPDMASGGAGVI